LRGGIFSTLYFYNTIDFKIAILLPYDGLREGKSDGKYSDDRVLERVGIGGRYKV